MRRLPDSLSLYLTKPRPCPYLPGRVEQKAMTPLDDLTGALGPVLTRRGFRRMQNLYYRQQCPGCRACLSCRLRLADFKPGDSFRRILRRNAQLTYSVEATDASEKNYLLFSKYVKARHDDGGMAEMTYADFAAMFGDTVTDTRFLICRDGEKVIGILLLDEMPDGTSAVYSFFDPDEEKRSLGTWMILKLAEYTAGTLRPYVYLGFWVKGSPKMDYKARFQPLEIFVDDKWVDFAP